MDRFDNATQFYDAKQRNLLTKGERQSSDMFDLKSFNNWIKAVLLNKYCEQRNSDLQRIYDLPPSYTRNLLHVLDIGSGHGQDLKKWQVNRVKYLVAVDISAQSLEEYRGRWKKAHEPYALKTVAMSASNPDLYAAVEHTFYDIVSSQLCIHYMFDKRDNVNNLLLNSLENLLVGGFLLLTIPDSLTIVKKIRELGERKGDYYIYGNDFFSMRFRNREFDRANGCYGLEYGFYLREAIGEKDPETGEIKYVNEYLIELENFELLLNRYNMKVVESVNFIEFYKQNKDKYQSLFDNFKLRFSEGQSIRKEFWDIAHCYRVVVAQKVVGRETRDFTISKRNEPLKHNCH